MDRCGHLEVSFSTAADHLGPGLSQAVFVLETWMGRKIGPRRPLAESP